MATEKESHRASEERRAMSVARLQVLAMAAMIVALVALLGRNLPFEMLVSLLGILVAVAAIASVLVDRRDRKVEEAIGEASEIQKEKEKDVRAGERAHVELREPRGEVRRSRDVSRSRSRDFWMTERALEAEADAPKPHAYMEVRSWLTDAHRWSQRELLEAAHASQIDTFGWPLGIVLNRPDFAPFAEDWGIFARVLMDADDRFSYDYWALRRTGDYYILSSLFEDERSPENVYFNTRIVRIAEAILRVRKLYAALGVADTETATIVIRHQGFKGRKISAVGSRSIGDYRPAVADESSSTITGPLGDFETNLVSYVKQVAESFFVLFDFLQLSDKVYEDIVDRWVQGEVS